MKAPRKALVEIGVANFSEHNRGWSGTITIDGLVLSSLRTKNTSQISLFVILYMIASNLICAVLISFIVRTEFMVQIC